jgi:hypothetical protein
MSLVLPPVSKGTVHLIGVDMELKRNQHIVMQWNDSYFCAANGIFKYAFAKIVPQKIVSINIHDRLPSDASGLDVFVWYVSYCQRRFQRYWKENTKHKRNYRTKSSSRMIIC